MRMIILNFGRVTIKFEPYAVGLEMQTFWTKIILHVKKSCTRTYFAVYQNQSKIKRHQAQKACELMLNKQNYVGQLLFLNLSSFIYGEI
jgi:hypothetical protein